MILVYWEVQGGYVIDVWLLNIQQGFLFIDNPCDVHDGGPFSTVYLYCKSWAVECLLTFQPL